MATAAREWTTPNGGTEPGLRQMRNGRGLGLDILPNGCVFQIFHNGILINQVPGSPLDGGILRIYLRIGGAQKRIVQAMGPGARVLVGVAATRALWEGENDGLLTRVTLDLHPTSNAWAWRVEAVNHTDEDLPIDALLVQDLGLGSRGFLMNNEAYASQYTDHHVETHPQFGPVLMSRQALAQDGRHPWVGHLCLEGAAGFATDGLDVFGPAYRDAADPPLPFGTTLPSRRLQHEMAMAALQGPEATLAPGETATWNFIARFEPDHPAASGPADLAGFDALKWPPNPASPGLSSPIRSFPQEAPPLPVKAFEPEEIAARWPTRSLEEMRDGRMLSFFVPDGRQNRHVVLQEKERLVIRRHGAIPRSRTSLLPDERTLAATHWMHGVFGAQLTIGNTSFHKLFSVSRDPYNVTRSSGLRILADEGEGWRLLTVPSAFEMALNGSRWLYQTETRLVTVEAFASGTDPVMRWQITVAGEPCRFLAFGHVVMGERELDHASRIEVDPGQRRLTFRPDPDWLWGQRYKDAVLHLTASEGVEAIGGGELLYDDGMRRGGNYVALRTGLVTRFAFAVSGSLTDLAETERLAGIALEDPPDAAPFWDGLLGDKIPAHEEWATLLPWLAHDAIIHLTVPHGLEQYTGGAWGTRDVAQGPVEFLLALGHAAPVRSILEILFAQQYEARGDWPQWFMLEPYSIIQDRSAHGDVIVWPLKALLDYLEATGDHDFLDHPVPWRNIDTLERTTATAPVIQHVEKLLETIQARFIEGTHLIRLGEGDWNDSLQPADPAMRDHMVSTWTVALLYQQIRRWAAILRLRGVDAVPLDALADAMAADFRALLMRDGTVAGYAVFGEGEPRLLLHPDDQTTGLHYSLLPMTQGILAGLFDAAEAAHHLDLIRTHLLCPDGARLIDRPPSYQGGIETIFRRAESAAYVGREIGLMYVHSHLRYAEAMALLGEEAAFLTAIEAVSPVGVTSRLPHATLRQRNAYFSSSDAAFPDRYAAAAGWTQVRDGSIPVDGGWRIYSSGPGLFTNLLVRHGRTT
jgi:cellobiose phosphorylase